MKQQHSSLTQWLPCFFKSSKEEGRQTAEQNKLCKKKQQSIGVSKRTRRRRPHGVICMQVNGMARPEADIHTLATCECGCAYVPDWSLLQTSACNCPPPERMRQDKKKTKPKQDISFICVTQGCESESETVGTALSQCGDRGTNIPHTF